MSRKTQEPTERDFALIEFLITPKWVKRIPTYDEAARKFKLSKGRVSQIVNKIKHFEEVNN